ncbi:alpha/beta fold hydrolase [Inconstantimicrobium porci]|uniref:alpha/beta fold hydrolase n=1 Tax=Inconstantimicrobium porci TaxID=2652291 RepID=UPI002409183E|nr:alpha/beta hydrolase [Inconstantimicrobium porci]MDD6771141.1 alpha/beta hydrolase [Inconstantimicrobium porci]
MIFKKFTNKGKPVIILIHGGGLSWWNYKDEIMLLKDDFEVVLPVIDGHGEDYGTEFKSIEHCAEEIIEYIHKNYDGRVFLIGGLSLGAQILTEILSRKTDICEKAVIESALVVKDKLINAIIGPSIKVSYGLIKKRWFARMQFKSLNIHEELFEDYYHDTCLIKKDNYINILKSNSSYNLKDSIENSKADVLILVGQKEGRKMIKSAELLNKKIKGTRLKILKGYTHGDLSINHAEEYVKYIRMM